MLEASGYRVVMATNGLEALRILRTRRPCIILLDLMMPIMDGLTFLAERKASGDKTDAVPVICVSAGGHEVMDEALRRGAIQCLPKPTDFEELCHAVNRYCPA